MSNYSATVVRITNVRPHKDPLVERLSITNIFGNNVVVGKDTKVGDFGLFFPLESQIGLEFAQANDLIRRKDPAGTGKSVGGMFDENRRVRAQKFKGEESQGFFIPIDSLEVFAKANNIHPMDVSNIFEGEEFEKLTAAGREWIVSQKYVPRHPNKNTAVNPPRGRKVPKESKIIADQFRFHSNTAQLGKNIHKLNPTDLIAITWKMHGTSAIAGNVLVKKKLNWLEKLAKRFGVPVVETKYDMVYSSRRVIQNEFEEDRQQYYGYSIYTEVGKKNFEGKLQAGETVYYEIVGFTKDGGYIQKGFDYGCSAEGLLVTTDVQINPRPQNKIYVYRITRTAPDGTVLELSWSQVKERCKQIGVETVPEVWYGVAYELLPLTDWPDNILSFLKENFVRDQDSQFCLNKVPEEGICVRKEGLEIEVFKLKSFRFLEGETKALDKGETNIEDEVIDDGDPSTDRA